MFTQTYIGFSDGASRSTQNLSYAIWLIYLARDEFVSINGVCLGQTMNNIAKYSVVIKQLFDNISFGI